MCGFLYILFFKCYYIYSLPTLQHYNLVFSRSKKTPSGCFVGADADSVQSWHSQRRLRANYPSLSKHLRLSYQYILLYAILVIARIHATFVASSKSAIALVVLQNWQHYNLVLPCSKKTPYWVFYFGAEDEIRTRDIRLGKATLYHWATPAY